MKKWKNDRIDRRIIILAIQSYYCGTYFTLFWSRENCYIGSGDEFLISEYLSYASLLSFTPHPPLINTTSHYITLRHTTLHHTKLHYTILYCSTTLHYTTSHYNTALYFCVQQLSTTQHNIFSKLHDIFLHRTARYNILQFDTIQLNSMHNNVVWIIDGSDTCKLHIQPTAAFLFIDT